jgi:guanylate kinase
VIGKLFIITAPSGAGKTTLIEKFLVDHKDLSFAKIITYTTRQPRQGEEQGIHYYFITHQEFEVKKAAGFFIEHSYAYGNYYGSAWDFMHQLEQGTSFFAILDAHGSQAIKKAYSQAVTIFLAPPDYKELEKRIMYRDAHLDSLTIQNRLNAVKDELLNLPSYDLFNYIITNDSLENRLSQLKRIVLSEVIIK